MRDWSDTLQLMDEFAESGSDTLRSLAPFITSLRAHAEAVAAGEAIDENELAACTDNLRMAARLYAEEVYEVSGWDNPFYDLFEEFDVDVDEEIDEDFEEFDEEADTPDDESDDSESEESRLSVITRYDFFVTDEDQFVASVRDRLQRELPDISADMLEEAVPDSVTAVCELLEMDGWDATQYEDIGLTSAGVSIEADAVDVTLSEIAEDETDELDEFDEDELDIDDADYSEFEDEFDEDEDEAEEDERAKPKSSLTQND